MTALHITQLSDILRSGAYLGGGALGHGPPFWVARIAKLHRKKSKIEACPPPLQVGHQALGSKPPDFGRKMERNLSEDLFLCSSPDFGQKLRRNLSEDLFFCSSPNFGRIMGRNLSVTISNSDLCSSQIF